MEHIRFSESWYKNLNSSFYGGVRDWTSTLKIAEAVSEMLKETGESLTATQILNLIDKRRFHCIKQKYLGKALREIEYGIEYKHLDAEDKNGDVYLYKYRDGKSGYRDRNGALYVGNDIIYD